MRLTRLFVPLRTVAFLALFASAHAEVSLPAIFGDHMVLQQQQTIPVWGKAAPGEAVTVELGKLQAKTVADTQGAWRVELPAQRMATAPTTLTVSGTNTVTLTDVLIGEVWVASGQSNMELGMKGTHDSAAVLAAAEQPLIRIFNVPHASAVVAQSELASGKGVNAYQSRWYVCTAEALRQVGASSGFTAVGYFFARDIQAYTHGPVGMIESTWGGTSAEAWTPADVLAGDVKFARTYAQHQKFVEDYPAALAAQPEKMAAYEKELAEFNKTARPQNSALMKEWQAAVAAAKAKGEPVPEQPRMTPAPVMPDPSGAAHDPSGLYNGMIAPLEPYAIRGVIWYQGESNGAGGMQYRDLFPAMIRGWRAHWGEGDFPFLYVQLPGYKSNWAMLREAQLMTLAVPKTGMAVAIDVGAKDQLHPTWKEPVGARLALIAEEKVYGAKVESSGPMYTGVTFQGNKAVVRFDHADGLQISSYPISGDDYTPVPTDKLRGFSVAGEDHVWHDAEAVIAGKTVVVSSSEVAKPVAVRYGWDPVYPVCNLYNGAKLPASPFRTDDWPAK